MTEETSQTPVFSLGLTYWPRRVGYHVWQNLDRSEVQEELTHIAALGCNTVRVCLTWEEFQPSANRVGTPAMRALEQILDAAQAAQLQVVALLFPVALGGVLHLPAWANGTNLIEELAGSGTVDQATVVRPPGGAPVFYDGSYHGNQARDLFSYGPVLNAQRHLAREVAGYFGAHPALWAWQLGEGLERIHRPSSADAVRKWLGTLAGAIHERHTGAQILGVTSAQGLTQRNGPRPEHLAEACTFVGVTAEPPEPPGEQRRHTSYAAFLHALTAGLAERPVIVTSFGMPGTADGASGFTSMPVYGRPQPSFIGDPEQQASFVEVALDRLRRAGAAGAWLASYADYLPGLWRLPPLDRAARERITGLVDPSGREKPAAEAVRRFAQTLQAAGGVASAPHYPVDPERYWRDPATAFAELWHEFNAQE